MPDDKNINFVLVWNDIRKYLVIEIRENGRRGIKLICNLKSSVQLLQCTRSLPWSPFNYSSRILCFHHTAKGAKRAIASMPLDFTLSPFEICSRNLYQSFGFENHKCAGYRGGQFCLSPIQIKVPKLRLGVYNSLVPFYTARITNQLYSTHRVHDKGG